jgi:hypothetical protein
MGKVFELVIEDENDYISGISLVEKPAIEEDFMYFSKAEVHFAQTNNEKRMLVGPILLADKQILRVDESTGETYHVYFSKSTVAKLAQNYLKNKLIDSATLEHDKKIKGVHLVESWIVEGKMDKSKMYGMDMPSGTWMGKFYIDESKEGNTIWNDYIKTGRVKGFSVEALMEHKLVKASAHTNLLDKNIVELNDEEASIILNKIKQLFQDTYSDYGQEIRNNAKRGIELNEKNNNKCATQTGKVRAQQLANGEAISVDTIQRMYSYLSRAETYYDETDMNACGTISYLLWGGKSALSWSRNKLKELGVLEENAEGVPHYTKDGELYTGPTHKGPDGRLMTGEVHTEDSEYLYHKEELEAQPSVSSTYPGEVASGSVAPALL